MLSLGSAPDTFTIDRARALQSDTHSFQSDQVNCRYSLSLWGILSRPCVWTSLRN